MVWAGRIVSATRDGKKYYGVRSISTGEVFCTDEGKYADYSLVYFQPGFGNDAASDKEEQALDCIDYARAVYVTIPLKKLKLRHKIRPVYL